MHMGGGQYLPTAPASLTALLPFPSDSWPYLRHLPLAVRRLAARHYDGQPAPPAVPPAIVDCAGRQAHPAPRDLVFIGGANTRPVVPILLAPRISRLIPLMHWQDKADALRDNQIIRANRHPCARKVAISRSRAAGSTTTPLPITDFLP